MVIVENYFLFALFFDTDISASVSCDNSAGDNIKG